MFYLTPPQSCRHPVDYETSIPRLYGRFILEMSRSKPCATHEKAGRACAVTEQQSLNPLYDGNRVLKHATQEQSDSRSTHCMTATAYSKTPHENDPTLDVPSRTLHHSRKSSASVCVKSNSRSTHCMVGSNRTLKHTRTTRLWMSSPESCTTLKKSSASVCNKSNSRSTHCMAGSNRILKHTREQSGCDAQFLASASLKKHFQETVQHNLVKLQ